MWFRTAERKVKVSVSNCCHRMLLTMFPLWFPKTIVDQRFLLWCLATFPLSLFSNIQYILENTKTQKHSHWFFLIFFFKGKCYFSRHSPLLLSFNLAKTLPFKLLQLRGNQTNKEKKTKKNKDKYRRIHQAWAKHCFSSTGEQSSSPLLFGPETSQEWTINTSLWTASRKNTHNAHF